MNRQFVRDVMKSVMEAGYIESCMTRTDLIKKTAEKTMDLYEEKLLPTVLHKERKKLRRTLHG